MANANYFPSSPLFSLSLRGKWWKISIPSLRWPTTVMAKFFYSRQNQFRCGKINFATAKSISSQQNQFCRGKVNFITAKSISQYGKINFTIRQNQFHHGKIIFIQGKINFTTGKSFSSTAKYISPRQNNFG